MHFGKLLVAALLPGLVPAAARAALRLPALVGAHMVLQRDQPVPIWGWAAPGEAVTVTFRGKTFPASAPGADGRWQARLPATPAGGPYTLTIQGQDTTITLDDVLVGDVWLAAGQSNMQFKVKDGPGGYEPVQSAEAEIAAARWPQIRLFTVAQATADRPRPEAGGSGWLVCGPATVAQFSAVAYFFGRELHRHYQVPVGLLVSSWGGTPAEAWVSAEGLRAFPEFQRPAAASAGALAASLTGDAPPQSRPAALFNGMVAPLGPSAVRGVIWYQGETNVGRAAQYRRLLPALIADWRRQWRQSDLPFLVVQLANFQPARPEPGDSDWAELREAQAQALTLPRTGLAVTIDIGEAGDIHPHNKQDVGRRLALLARRVAYNDRAVVAHGPAFAGLTVAGGEARLRFAQPGRAGLVAQGGPLRGFAVAGADRKFYWATARVQGDKVVLRCPQVPAPVAVRYNWADNPNGNLYNSAGLPAAPFRTDAWAGPAPARQGRK